MSDINLLKDTRKDVYVPVRFSSSIVDAIDEVINDEFDDSDELIFDSRSAFISGAVSRALRERNKNF